MVLALNFNKCKTLNPLPKLISDRWTTESLREFCILARQFAAETRFAEFFTQHQAFFEKPVKEMQKIVDKEADLEWFSQFFRISSPVEFRLILSLNNGDSNYGARFQDKDLLFFTMQSVCQLITSIGG